MINLKIELKDNKKILSHKNKIEDEIKGKIKRKILMKY